MSRRCCCGGSDDGFECYLVPIDACYELVGIVRQYWEGSAVVTKSGGGSTSSSRVDREARAVDRTGGGAGADVDLDFTCTGAEADRYAAIPTIRLHLRIEETTGQRRCTHWRCGARSGSNRSGDGTTTRRPRGSRTCSATGPAGARR